MNCRTPTPAAGRLPSAQTHDLTPSQRQDLILLMTQRLADATALQSRMKQIHGNVKVPSFIALHELFAEVYGTVVGYVELITKRIVQLSGLAEGTVRLAAAGSLLAVNPCAVAGDVAQVDAISRTMAPLGQVGRASVYETKSFEYAASAECFAEVTRGVDRWLWFVEAQEQATI